MNLLTATTPFRHTLPVPDWLFDMPIYVTHAGWEQSAAGGHCPLKLNDDPLYDTQFSDGRRIPEFCLALVLSGAGEIETSGCHQRLSQGEAFLNFPGEWHRQRPLPKTGWTLLWMNFSGNLPHQWMNAGTFLLDGCKPIISDPTLFRAQFERLVLTAHRSPANNSSMMSWQAAGLLSHLLDDHDHSRAIAPADDNITERAIEFIWSHIHNDLCIQDLVDRLQLSRRSLERHFKQATGHTLLDEIQACRSKRARRLLGDTDLPIKQVALTAGFRSDDHLQHVFKKQFGLSPDAYRTSVQASGSQ